MKDQKNLKIKIKTGEEFLLDDTRIAVWERFIPYKKNESFFKHYNRILQKGGFYDSLTKRTKMWSLANILEKIIKKNPNYNVAECGCFKGLSTYIMAKILEENNFSQEFFVFDSFEGFPDLTEHDYKGITNSPYKKGSFSISEKKFRDNVGDFNFMNVKKGWIPECFENITRKNFCFVNIDVDIYQPTKDSLDFFYPRLVEGGCIHIDDYNFREWPGCYKAVKEFEEKTKPAFSYEIPLGGYFLIK